MITSADLGLKPGGSNSSVTFNLREVRARAERRSCRVLAITDNNISRAADLLGMTRPTLYDLMNKHNLNEATQQNSASS